MPQEQILVLIGIILVTFGLWLMRNTPLGFLWRWYKIFWIVLLATLFINKAKGDIKEWWNKD